MGGRTAAPAAPKHAYFMLGCHVSAKTSFSCILFSLSVNSFLPTRVASDRTGADTASSIRLGEG